MNRIRPKQPRLRLHPKLNVEWFSSLENARQKLAKFRGRHNHQRPPKTTLHLFG
jgi:hypothetical protein